MIIVRFHNGTFSNLLLILSSPNVLAISTQKSFTNSPSDKHQFVFTTSTLTTKDAKTEAFVVTFILYKIISEH